MASSRPAVALTAILLVLSACAADNAATSPVITRALLPPADTAGTEPAVPTTLPPLSPAEADQLAQSEVRAVLAAAEELYAQTGTFNAGLYQIADLVPGVPVVSLEDAALTTGVVYDAYDQRLTLHRESASGRWFCVDVSRVGKDHGFGDSFERALTACTDGVSAPGWGDSLSPTGPDEAAIKAVLGSLVSALEAGDTRAAHATFSSSACSTAELQAVWPTGLGLVDSAEYELRGIGVAGDRATVSIALGSISDIAWPMSRDDNGWRHTADPCNLLGPIAADRMNQSTRELLDRALFAVQSAFVLRSDFAFSPAVLADLDADLLLVPAGEVSFGTVSYAGSQSEGLLLTAGSPGQFYCAVESLSAPTVFGQGSTLDDLSSAARCRANASP